MLEGLPLPDWIPISQAFKITIIHVGGNRKRANALLIGALKAGRIRNAGVMEDWSDAIRYRGIHLNSDDFMRWLHTVPTERMQ